ncbi:MAG: hypothetical protein KBD16_00340 [Candidatus Pacebacteria bacterium]|nr:hypothetical protein [Candidatus Paceibacterota bacterium]
MKKLALATALVALMCAPMAKAADPPDIPVVQAQQDSGVQTLAENSTQVHVSRVCVGFDATGEQAPQFEQNAMMGSAQGATASGTSASSDIDVGDKVAAGHRAGTINRDSALDLTGTFYSAASAGFTNTTSFNLNGIDINLLRAAVLDKDGQTSTEVSANIASTAGEQDALSQPGLDKVGWQIDGDAPYATREGHRFSMSRS